jgi:hypothetical protein
VLLLIAHDVSVSQQISKQTIDHAIDKYCVCLYAASDTSKLSECQLNIDTTSLKLSETDEFYISRKIIRQCGKVHPLFNEHATDLEFIDGVLLMRCTSFSENELRKFSLKLDSSSLIFHPIIYEAWLPDLNDKSGSIILKLEQYRQTIDENDIKKWEGNEQKSLEASKVVHSYFDFISIVGQEDSLGYKYAIVARERELVLGLTVVLKEKNTDIINDLIKLLADKVRACEL